MRPLSNVGANSAGPSPSSPGERIPLSRFLSVDSAADAAAASSSGHHYHHPPHQTPHLNVGSLSPTTATTTLSTSSQFAVHLAPPSPPRRSRSRQGSGISNLSLDHGVNPYADNMSTISGGSLAYYFRVQEDQEDTVPCLVLSRLEKIPLRDFSAEVRANLDIEKFVKEAVVLLDVEAQDLETIVDRLLRAIHSSSTNHEILAEMKSDDAFLTEAKRALFMQINVPTYSYQRLSKTIRGISIADQEGLTTDQSWLCALCALGSLTKRRMAIARLCTPANLGRSSEGIYFVVLIITPKREKGTKNDIELGRTFATILSDIEFRQQLMFAPSEAEFKALLQMHAKDLSEEQRLLRRKSLRVTDLLHQDFSYDRAWPFANGIKADLRKRIAAYPSDFRDGVSNLRNARKVFSTTMFLYFACLLPSIAFGVLNDKNTGSSITVPKMIVSQTFGGLCFALVGGQPLIILLSTAPLALYTKVIYSIADVYTLDFYLFYGWVGIFNSFFLVIYALFDISKLMRWSTRSTEEIFAVFISIAFIVDASRDIYRDFVRHYFAPACTSSLNQSQVLLNASEELGNSTSDDLTNVCRRDTSILYLLLAFGTLWLATSLFNFTKTPFLNSSKRELMADFALPLSVIVMSFVGSFVFKNIKFQPSHTGSSNIVFRATPLHKLPWQGIVGATALAFPLSLLFFMDQNISSAMVNCPSNKLRKGSAYHWDLLVVAIINGILSIFGLPWVHGALPHSPLHVKALADLEERVDVGHRVQQFVVRPRETRLTGVFSHVLIGCSLLMLPNPLGYIPVAVLDGLFMYMAITALYGNQMFERILLFFTEQAAYPPSHYLRRVPQRKVHLFTSLQLAQLVVMCTLGFSPIPYLKMSFPILLMLQIPIRHFVFPKIIDERYLQALDKSS